MRRGRFRTIAAALAAAVTGLLGTSCTSGGPPRHEPVWHEVSLPAPPGPPGRVALRDAAYCDGRWYVVGGVYADGGADAGEDGRGDGDAALGAPVEAYPAAWTSTDGRDFRSVRVRADTFWGALATLTSVACTTEPAGEPADEPADEPVGERRAAAAVVAVGARSGGAHGNPRVTSFRGPAAGPLDDVHAATTLYGGSEALAVYGVASGPGASWLIAGARTTGGAVWTSGDGEEFTLLDDDPALASGGGLDTMVADAVHDRAGPTWQLVGTAHRDGRVAPVPMAWSSPDGKSWVREEVPAPDGYGSLDRVAVTGAGPVAAGVAGQEFGVWRRAGGAWRDAARFGAVAAEATGSPYVAGLAVVPGGVLAAVSDGARYALWAGAGDGSGPWRAVVVPSAPTTGADRLLTVAAGGGRVMLLADDERTAGAWTTTWPPGG